jgi:4,5-dihydroxyphthalate decarboxylase
VHMVVVGQPEGIVLTPFILPVEEIFYRFSKHLEWDVSEFSFAKYIAMTSQGDAPMIAIPVFPSRVFRHSAIYVGADSGFSLPADLNGKRVGVPEWAQTAGIYVRGMLQESYGVDLASIEWVQAGVNQAGREEKVQLNLPNGIRCKSRPDATLNDLLIAGEIDAVISARPPAAITSGDRRIIRLFNDPQKEERRYWDETGVFPIMHAVTIRRSVLERHPWVAGSLQKAFEEARRRAVARVLDITASRIPLPWGASFAAEIQSSFGEDFWPYGIETSRKTLAAFCRFAHEQGVARRTLEPEELFAAEVHSSVRV